MPFNFIFIFPVLVAIRWLKRGLLFRSKIQAESDFKLPPMGINRTIIRFHDLERTTIFQYNKWFGVNIYCLCKKE